MSLIESHYAVSMLMLLGLSTSTMGTELVTTTSDSGGGSLRQAILNADASGGGEVVFNVTGTITLLSPLPGLTNLVLTATNPITVSGNAQFQIFYMPGGTSNTLSGLTISDGALTSGSGLAGGGGIYNAGSLMLRNCTVTNCEAQAYRQGGGIYNAGDLLMRHCKVTDCHAYYQVSFLGVGDGGGIASAGELRMEDCMVSNCVGQAGGGVYSTSNLFLTNCIIVSCVASSQGEFGVGGGLYGSGTIHSCIISNCSSADYSGGIDGENLAITNSIIAGNSAFWNGGGLGIEGTGVVVGCTVMGNDAIYGGGILNQGFLSLLNCTVSGNDGYEGAEVSNGEAYLDQSTNATIYLDHCTVTCNTNLSSGFGILNGGICYLRNTLFAAVGTNDYFFGGVLNSQGYNLIRTTNGCTIVGDETGNIYGADPLLGPLQDNGGPTWTHALLPGSPAIDAGISDGLATDQRGLPRVFDVPGWPNAADGADIGAYELSYPFPAFSSVSRVPATNAPNISLQFIAIPGQIYTLETSTNLTCWQDVATSAIGPNGLWEIVDQDARKYPRRYYRARLRAGPGSVLLPAASGVNAAPFLVMDGSIYQPIETTCAAEGGRAEYDFTIAKAGAYVLQATVNAPALSENSFFVNIDAEPQAPMMIWDIPVTTGFQQRLVSWRGDGTATGDEFVPKVFMLAEGAHQLIVRGREANVFLQSVIVMPNSVLSIAATSGTVTGPFTISSNYIFQAVQSGVADGGRAAYGFVITNAGDYVIQAMVSAPVDIANSFFLNIDAEPQDPSMIWDIPLTTGFEQRVVSWRGNGTPSNSQFVPKVFSLSRGAHQLIVRGREAYTELQALWIVQYPLVTGGNGHNPCQGGASSLTTGPKTGQHNSKHMVTKEDVDTQEPQRGPKHNGR